MGSLSIVVMVFALVGLIAGSTLAQQQHSYVGVKSCKMCHKGKKKGEIYEKWEQNKHSKATEALIEKGKASNPQCLKCHSTGFGEGGYDPTAEDKDKFAGVQCEACYGPGSDYKKISVMKSHEESVANGLIVPTEETCVKCHNASHHKDLEFDFKSAWKKIEHRIPRIETK